VFDAIAFSSNLGLENSTNYKHSPKEVIVQIKDLVNCSIICFYYAHNNVNDSNSTKSFPCQLLKIAANL